MVDTARTITDLLTNLFQDGQGAGAITANDVRDLIISLQTAHGAMTITSAVETVIATVDVYAKALGTTTLRFGAKDFDMPVNNRLRYTGTPDRHVFIFGQLSMTAAANNKDTTVTIGLNGTADDVTSVDRKIGTGTDIGALGLLWEGVMSTNDYVELFIKNTTDAVNLTVTKMVFIVEGFAE